MLKTLFPCNGASTIRLGPLLALLSFPPAHVSAYPASVATYAQLRGLPPPSAAAVVSVGGHTTPGDGGGGSFRFDPLSGAPDNDGTIIAPAQTPRGRFLRVYVKDLSVKWFGARGDGRAFDNAAAQRAVDALRPGDTLHFPNGVYRIETDKGVKLKNDVRLDLGTAVLAGANVAGVRCRIFEIQGARNILISGGTLVGSRGGAPEWAVGILASDAQNVFIENVHFRDFYFDGILVTGNLGARKVVIRNCVFLNNRRSGLTVAAATDVTVADSVFQGSQGQEPESGVNVEPGPGAFVRDVRFERVTVVRNAGIGLYIHRGRGERVSGASVSDSVIQGNAHGIVVDEVEGLRVVETRVAEHRERAHAGIAVEQVTGAVITDNDLSGNFRGIYSAGSTAVEIRRNVILGTGPQVGEESGEDGEGIVCRGLFSPLANSCVVANNVVRRAAGSGILALLVSGVRLLDNQIDETGQRGVQLRYTSRGEVRGNVVSRTGLEAPRRYDALEIAQFSDANLVSANVIRLGAGARRALGIEANCRGNRVLDNVVLP
ncbi:MAG TPA: right-handed parallel beta-helix repeat-containing protein [Vicinamibacteria bacterium]